MKLHQKGFGAVEMILIFVAVSIVAFAGWYVYDSTKKTKDAYDASTSVSPVGKYDSKKVTVGKKITEPVISDSLKENAAAAIDSKNTAALEGYMTDSVTVVFAASEKGGTESAVQAIKDLDYLQAATSPWDFKLTAPVLDSYKSGAYKQYFGENTIVGKSANGYVVSFGVNSAGKIDTVFVAASSDLLQ